MKVFFKKFLLFLMVILPFLSLVVVKADSGWDSSYDSGGSSSSSSSSSSGGYSSSSSSSSSSYSSGEGGGSIFDLFVFVIVVIVILVIALSSNKNNNNSGVQSSLYKDIPLEKLQEIFPDFTLEYVKEATYKKFIEIQNAWMNFEYDKLRELCTDELYNSYVAQLETLKLKNGQNIMSDFTLQHINVTNIKEENGNVTVTIYLKVSFKDYVINQKTKAVIRGTSSSKITNNYIMTFVRSKNTDKKIDKCPNCGAELTDKASTKCEYCNSDIVKDSGDFVLSKKTNINR